MDSGPGPPQQSPDDYSARERRERTGVAVGITIGVLVLFAGPLCLLWYANWRRKRRIRKGELRDLEGTTAISRDEKYGTNSFENTAATTLTATLTASEEPTQAEVVRWRNVQDNPTETELERLKRDPTSPLNSLPKPIEHATPKEVLGLDKTSYLRNLPVATSSPSVLPSRLPHETIDFAGESSKQQEGKDIGKCISPWAVEHEPNPVIFKHLLGPRGENPGRIEAATQADGFIHRNEVSPERRTVIEVTTQLDEEMQHAVHNESSARAEQRSRESSALEEPSGSSPSSSTSSQDSSNPLLFEGSTKGHSQSPTSFRLPVLHQQVTTGLGSGSQITQSASKRSCEHCDRTFITTGQLNAHIHRKHVRRYSCAICPSTFHLKTDLKRHELTVHRKDVPTESRGFRCPNQGCSIPKKIFLRRDNYERHVTRCSRRQEDEEGQ